ncbi:hypothetical protein J2S06_002429 [Bacillus alveayuensis]|uniref:Transposase n=1 Tax=Aeribacillus alveayuensis TaxID=279215 RepID=A0ABT9VQV1_9BACI|nr:hypothetical protein [Bacillus alveayuensis]
MFERKVINISITSILKKGNHVRKISEKIYLHVETKRDDWIFRRR